MRKTAGFRAEEKGIAAAEALIRITARRPAGKREQPRRSGLRLERIECFVLANLGPLVVIQPRTSQPSFVQMKSQGPNQMQAGTGVGAKAYNIAGVRWDLRLVKDHMKHDAE